MKTIVPQSSVLLVEGKDDKNVVIHLSAQSGLEQNFRIIEKDGREPLLDSIVIEARTPGRKNLGILLDADDDVNACWQAVKGKLDRLRMEDRLELSELPDQPDPTGTIIEGTLRIGIWLMPDNCSSGELEDFVESLIPSVDPVWSLSNAYIEGIPLEVRKFTPGKVQRAKVHAWLATRERPRPMGLAIKTRDLDIDVASATVFAGWLRELFRDSAQ